MAFQNRFDLGQLVTTFNTKDAADDLGIEVVKPVTALIKTDRGYGRRRTGTTPEGASEAFVV